MINRVDPRETDEPPPRHRDQLPHPRILRRHRALPAARRALVGTDLAVGVVGLAELPGQPAFLQLRHSLAPGPLLGVHAIERNRHRQRGRPVRDPGDPRRIRLRDDGVPRPLRVFLRAAARPDGPGRGPGHSAVLRPARGGAHRHLLGVDPSPDRAVAGIQHVLDAHLLPRRPGSLSRRPASTARTAGRCCGGSWCRSPGRRS